MSFLRAVAPFAGLHRKPARRLPAEKNGDLLATK